MIIDRTDKNRFFAQLLEAPAFNLRDVVGYWVPSSSGGWSFARVFADVVVDQPLDVAWTLECLDAEGKVLAAGSGTTTLSSRLHLQHATIGSDFEVAQLRLQIEFVA